MCGTVVAKRNHIYVSLQSYLSHCLLTSQIYQGTSLVDAITIEHWVEERPRIQYDMICAEISDPLGRFPCANSNIIQTNLAIAVSIVVFCSWQSLIDALQATVFARIPYYMTKIDGRHGLYFIWVPSHLTVMNYSPTIFETLKSNLPTAGPSNSWRSVWSKGGGYTRRSYVRPSLYRRIFRNATLDPVCGRCTSRQQL